MHDYCNHYFLIQCPPEAGAQDIAVIEELLKRRGEEFETVWIHHQHMLERQLKRSQYHVDLQVPLWYQCPHCSEKKYYVDCLYYFCLYSISIYSKIFFLFPIISLLQPVSFFRDSEEFSPNFPFMVHLMFLNSLTATMPHFIHIYSFYQSLHSCPLFISPFDHIIPSFASTASSIILYFPQTLSSFTLATNSHIPCLGCPDKLLVLPLDEDNV